MNLHPLLLFLLLSSLQGQATTGIFVSVFLPSLGQCPFDVKKKVLCPLTPPRQVLSACWWVSWCEVVMENHIAGKKNNQMLQISHRTYPLSFFPSSLTTLQWRSFHYIPGRLSRLMLYSACLFHRTSIYWGLAAMYMLSMNILCLLCPSFSTWDNQQLPCFVLLTPGLWNNLPFCIGT